MAYKDFEAMFGAVFADLEKYGADYAGAKAISWQLQENRKSMLAMETLKQTGTAQERENRARISEIYRQHIEGTAHAIKEEHRLKSLYDNAYARYEALRSLCSLENSRMREKL